jgi:serine/threonine protein kinase
VFPLPSHIGEYEVVRRLSVGGGAEIFLGHETGPMGFSRDVVLKLVRAHGEGDPGHAAELAREARICARLQNPGIVRMYDFFEERGRLALVLEYVDGPALDELIAYLADHGEVLGDDEACYIAGSVIAALAHAHAMTDDTGARTPVLHRALSPKKVLVSRDASVKLTGFGLAKILDRTPDSAAGLIRATHSMAPEHARGARVDERADVYAAGVLCWQLLAGKSKSPTELEHMMTGVLPSLRTLRSDLPRELVAAIDAALEPERVRRTITCASLSAWIAKVAHLQEGKAALRAHVEAFHAAEEREANGPESTTGRTYRRRARTIRRPSLGVRAIAREASRSEEGSENVMPAIPPQRALTRMGIGAPPIESVPVADEPEEVPLAAPTPRKKRRPLLVAAVTITMLGALTLLAFVVVRWQKPELFVETPAVDGSPQPSESAPASAQNVVAASISPSAPVPPLPSVSVSVSASVSVSVSVSVSASASVSVSASVSASASASASPSPSASSSTIAASTKSASSIASAFTSPSAKSSSSASASASASAKAPPSASTSATPIPVPSTSALPKGWGWLVVHSKLPGKVFIGYKLAGERGTPIATPCGPRSIALGIVDKNGNWLRWSTTGEWVYVTCGGALKEMTIK